MSSERGTPDGRGASTTLTVGSLFSGIGGIDLGLQMTGGFETRWMCEIDPWCRRVLAKHWPDVPCYEDVTTLDFETVEHVDVICGGFPCQDISNAGQRAGLSGERSGLWREMLRAVRVVRPRFLLVENVAAITNRGMATLHGELAALGYDVESDCIPAAAVGAPHIRDRAFVLAYPSDDWTGRRKQQSQGGEGTAQVANANERGRDGWSGAFGACWWTQPTDCGWWIVEPALDRVATGIPRRVDRLRGLGNAVVPQVVEHIGRMILEAA